MYNFDDQSCFHTLQYIKDHDNIVPLSVSLSHTLRKRTAAGFKSFAFADYFYVNMLYFIGKLVWGLKPLRLLLLSTARTTTILLNHTSTRYLLDIFLYSLWQHAG